MAWLPYYVNIPALLPTLKRTYLTSVSPTFYTLNVAAGVSGPTYANCPKQANTEICTGAGTNNFGGLTTAQITAQLQSKGTAAWKLAGANLHSSRNDECRVLGLECACTMNALCVFIQQHC